MIQLHNYKHVFLDRDGIINEVVLRNGVVSSPRNLEEFTLKRDFLDFYERLDGEYSIYVVTNQPDIKRKLLKVEDLHTMHDLILGCSNIRRIIYCPHDDEDCCKCRKPKPGMLNQIIEDFNLRHSECLMIGDTEKDALSAKEAEIDFVLLETEYNQHIATAHHIESLMHLVE